MAAHAEATLTPLELAAWEGLRHAHAALVRELDAELEAHHGLSLSTYSVLEALRRAPGARLRMADLAAHAQLSRSGMTRLVDRLERQGWIRRCSCADDARGCFAVLTPAGAAQAEVAAGTYAATVRERFAARLGEAELAQLAQCLGRCRT
jgi:DNA-binding MarR family transcriptional regulator